MTDHTHEEPLEPDLPIIDTHTHLSKESAHPETWPAYPDSALAADRAASGQNVVASIHVDAAGTGYLTEGPEEMRVIGETRTVESWARAAAGDETLRGISAAIVGHADMRLGARAEDVLRAHMAESPRFRGIRQVAHWQAGKPAYEGMDVQEAMLRQPAFAEGVACLGRLGLTFDARVDFAQLPDVAYLARAVPGTSMVLNHTGVPFGLGRKAAAEHFDTWRAGMAEVAACPNVAVKIGALFMVWHKDDRLDYMPGSAEAAEGVRDHVLTTIDLFSPGRCMFEGNFPVDRQGISYGNLGTAFKRLTAGFTRQEREAMFAGTAARVYRIGL